MADHIVVLSDSDDDDDNLKNLTQENIQSFNKSDSHVENQRGAKRKLHSTTTVDEDELPLPKKSTLLPEISARKIEQRANCSTPKLPQIVAVETLATPSATPPLQLLASPPRNTNTPRDNQQPLSPQSITFDASIMDSSKSQESKTTTNPTSRRVQLTTILKESDNEWQELRQKMLQATTTTTTSSAIGCRNSFDLERPPELIIPEELEQTKALQSFKAAPALAVMDLTHSPPARNSTKITTKEEFKAPKITTTATVAPTSSPNSVEKPALEKEYEELLNVCREADTSADMQKLIDTKLLKYYYSVHPDFVKSRGFRKTVTACIERIRDKPDLVYFNLKVVVDELNARRKSKDVVITNDEASPSGAAAGNGSSSNSNTNVPNKHTEEQIRKLNRALYVLKKRISHLEEAEVDWDDEDSTYLQVERFKKRACQIYEKICDLTGESKSAKRSVKKPIQFNGTAYPTFNKTLEAYVNRTKQFPDFFDVLHMLEHCNKKYDLKLASFETKRIAQDAFLKIGKLLQTRRKTDLYEMVSHFTSNIEDPAKSDPVLMAKLNENQKTHSKINEILDTYARAQEDPTALNEIKKQQEENSVTAASDLEENGDGDGDDDDDLDDEEDGNIDTHVENLSKDNIIDLSDDELETGEATTNKEANESDTHKDIVAVTETTLKNNVNLKLTENNNILRTKTNETDKTDVTTNSIIKATATTTTTTTTLPTTSPTPTNVALINNVSKEAQNIVVKPEVTTNPTTKTITQKATTKDPKLLRTIAEIVISDEE